MTKERCPWASGLDIAIKYHDEEWGVPCYDDFRQFEFLVLESAQAGLSWNLILKKRQGYREAFADFDPVKVASFTQADVERLIVDPAIIRNRLKIESTISNARIFLELKAKHGSFAHWLWGFVDGKPIVNNWDDISKLPANTPLSDAISKEMKRLGFKFMGSTVVYSHLQATGLINDHLKSCFRYQEILEMYKDAPEFGEVTSSQKSRKRR
ncbi:MAG: DNA-3-methyladenine glycosylase I [Deltaproteobacteria bacterium]|jgi:DNA-3-methyladenine glycosylase I|nr:DNA-3-methyladenine glycosylase I [Deltaproteobacteria bacterium]